MGLTNGKLVRPFNTADVSKAIGKGSLDVGTLCSSSTINKWSKAKPFVYAKWGFDTQAAMLAAAAEKNYGFSSLGQQQVFTTWNTFAASTMLSDGVYSYGFQAPWVNVLPQGGANEPFRLLDFEGYVTTNQMYKEWGFPTKDYKSVGCPMGIYAQASTSPLESTSVITIDRVESSSTDGLIYISDLTGKVGYAFGNWYFGLMLCESRGGQTSASYENYFHITGIKGTNVTDEIKINVGTAVVNNQKNFLVVPVLCSGIPYNGSQSQQGQWVGGTNGQWPKDSSGNALTVIAFEGNYFGPIGTTKSLTGFVTLYQGMDIGSTTTTWYLYMKNNLAYNTTISNAYAYVVSDGVEGTGGSPDDVLGIVNNYVADCIANKRAAANASATLTDSAGKVVARKITWISSNTALNSGADVEKSVALSALSDGYSYAYDGMSTVAGVVSYTYNDGTARTIWLSI